MIIFSELWSRTNASIYSKKAEGIFSSGFGELYALGFPRSFSIIIGTTVGMNLYLSIILPSSRYVV